MSPMWADMSRYFADMSATWLDLNSPKVPEMPADILSVNHWLPNKMSPKEADLRLICPSAGKN